VSEIDLQGHGELVGDRLELYDFGAAQPAFQDDQVLSVADARFDPQRHRCGGTARGMPGRRKTLSFCR
jgi:hypothetical protein